ncbi:HAD family hydrolase [Blastococcus sp. CT_GayMR16]|uniref:HAD family hydrolase n=1 Tax=Blastococcus sp. CT_GayMR16 TaxID=2559607 RepID=UPI001073F7FC|nr:HAD family hydrolase [Blastococcus sp. CT_GayMR16]TFV86158.1 HAD family hydrolase [Blastococcus sp. CT_GayMR16]
MVFRAVLLDWRGTLVTTLTEEDWARQALLRLGRPTWPDLVDHVAARLRTAEAALDAPGTDTDAGVHRRTYLQVLSAAGLDDDLVQALYAVESDPGCNTFAVDVADTLRLLNGAGLRIAVVSDVHVDIRPAFEAAGLAGLVDVFTLSFEQGVQKPDPAMFTHTLSALGVAAGEALMVGDRSRPDGAAVESGITTLLVPPLTGPEDRRLHLVLALCGVASGHISHAR